MRRGWRSWAMAGVLLGTAPAAPGQDVAAGYNVREYGAAGDGEADDTAAIQAAFEAAKKSIISFQPEPGTAYVTSYPTIYFPNGKYRLSAPIVPTANMLGEGNAILHQTDPEQDIISHPGAWRWRISGFTFLDGRHHLNIGNANIDTGRIIIDRCNFYSAAGVAVNVLEGSNSTQITVTNCVFAYCDQAMVNWCDMARVADSWVTTAPTMEAKAVFENHGLLLLEHVLGVPLVTRENDQRWIDNYGGVTCRNVRFGGEGAGFTTVVNWVRYKHEYPVIPSYVVFEACNVYALGNPKRKAMIYCEEVPNQIIVRDCNGFPDLPVIAVSEGLDIDAYFDDAAQRADACLRFLIAPGQVELRLGELPEQMRPYQANEVVADGPPKTGRWREGAFVRNKQAEPRGWVCTEAGKPGLWREAR